MTTGSAATTTNPRRWWMLGFLSAAMTMVMIDATVLNVGVPQLSADIGARPSDVQWFNAMYALVFAALLITFGQVSLRERSSLGG